MGGMWTFAAITKLPVQFRKADRQSNFQVAIGTYENKIGVLEKTKARMHDNLTLQAPDQPSTTGRFDKMLELSLSFLTNPCKLWESGNLILRRTLLRLAFTEGFAYHQNEGAGTPKLSLLFKVLGVFQQGKIEMVRPNRQASNARRSRCFCGNLVGPSVPEEPLVRSRRLETRIIPLHKFYINKNRYLREIKISKVGICAKSVQDLCKEISPCQGACMGRLAALLINPACTSDSVLNAHQGA